MLWEDSKIAVFTLADLGEKGQLRLGQEQGALLTSGFGGRSVVVKVAHHGSADQSPEFYEAIKPALALISVGLHNSYGHPTDRTLNFLQYIGSQVLRTDKQGAIGVTETETGLEVSVAGRS
jgi:competence protein ComEC